jgi:hypothetical protein
LRSGGFLGIWGLSWDLGACLGSGGYSWDLGDIFSAKLMFPGEVTCEGVAAICSLGRCSLLLILGLLSSLVCSCKEIGRHPQTITSDGCSPFFFCINIPGSSDLGAIVGIWGLLLESGGYLRSGGYIFCETDVSWGSHV